MNPLSQKRRAQRNPFRDIQHRPAPGIQRVSLFGGIARFILLIFIGCGAGGAGIAAQGYLFFTHNLPSIEKLRNYRPPLVSHFYADQGELLGWFAYQQRFVRSIEDIPKMLQNAFVAAEDKNFWTHEGLDREAIVRAIINNLKTGGLDEGASTITQQVAKTFLLTSEKKFIRKIKEIILSVRIEKAFEKEYILYLYVNQIYFGSGAHGVEAAALIYFGKHVNELTIAECATLAGLVKAPSKSSPKVNPVKSLERRHYALGRMLGEGYINQEQYDRAREEELHLVNRVNPFMKVAPDFTEHVRRYIIGKYGEKALYEEGLQVYTTVDLAMTDAAQRAVERGITELDRRQGYRGPLNTLNVKGVMEFLEEKTKDRKEPLKFGDVTEGVITHIDDRNIYVRLGSYIKGDIEREYVGKILVDPNAKWWIRKPYIRAEMRTRNFAEGDLPFQVGDLITVRLLDPNVKRKELYLRKYGKSDPEMKNYKRYSEDMLDYFPLVPEQEPRAQTALMLKENRTGYVRVLIGGTSFSDSKFNRATQSRRPPGSSFKPVIYAAALNKGFTCADTILDNPFAIKLANGEFWRPRNYGGGFHGPVTFRDSLVKSRNIPTIKILKDITIDNAKAYARKLGYTSRLANNLTMALGSTGVSLEEQTEAFSVFPNRGYLVPGVYVKKIVDRDGKIIEQNDPPVLLDDPLRPDQPRIERVSHSGSESRVTGEKPLPQGAPLLRRRIDGGTAYIMTSLLQGVVQEGTATILKKIVGRPDIAGKTGTTNSNLDAWFMGFSPDYTCGVWVGFDDERSLGDGETGGRAAAPIWGYLMKDILAGKPIKEFQAPETVEYRRVDPKTGIATDSPYGRVEIFKKGSGPSEQTPHLVKGTPWTNSGFDRDQM